MMLVMLGIPLSKFSAVLIRRRADIRFAAVAFGLAFVLCTVLVSLIQTQPSPEWAGAGIVACIGTVGIVPSRARRRAWRLLRRFVSRRAEHANATVRLANIVRMPRVVDGDTIDDQATGIRYRLASVDAPETGKRAGCYSERKLGEMSKAETTEIVGAAKLIEARPTGRIDAYGRTVAYLYVDGVELGDILVRRGLARPWRGDRKHWCGRRGGMLKMARRANVPWQCSACGQHFEPSTPSKVGNM